YKIPIKNFPPIGEFELPEYELQKLSFPPILQMLDYIQREKFTEIIISTPGPVGLTALLAAKCSTCKRAASITPIFHNTSAFLPRTGSLKVWRGVTCTGSMASSIPSLLTPKNIGKAGSSTGLIPRN